MFGGAKPAFGQSSTGAGFGFTNTATPSFGQSSFGKPAAAGFGQAGAFGQQNTSLFGSTQNPGGLFGSTNTSGFGATAAAQPTFGGFTQPAQNTSLFGATTQNANQSSLFGQTSASAFGTTKPSGFGFGQTQPTTSLFGQATTANTAGGSFGFGQAPNTSVFGSSGIGFGQTNNPTATGSAIAKYQPLIGSDTLMRSGQSTTVSTRQHCITAMKEYENKSLEELRMEDYLANRKGPQSGTATPFGQAQPGTSGSLFGTTSTQPTTGLFGQQPENKSLFGTTNAIGNTGFGTGTTAFGTTSQAPASFFSSKPFSTPSTSTTGFGFGSTNNTNNPFGAKTYGQAGSTGIFGAQTQTTAPAFGQTQTGFSGFGNTSQQSTFFGNTSTDNKANFGLTSTAGAGFGGFGANTNTIASGGGLFSAKPTGGFGAAPAISFGNNTSTPSTFGGFGTATTGGSLGYNPLNKLPTTGFGGFGTQTSMAPLGSGLNFGGGNQMLFGNNANKPGIFGNTSQAGTGLFGNTGGFNSSGALGTFGSNTMGGSLLGSSQQPSVPIHQQIMALTTSPYGDNPIFKDLKPSSIDETDSLRPTNPAAQKAILDSATKQFKVSSKSNSAGVKVKPVGNTLTKAQRRRLKRLSNKMPWNQPQHSALNIQTSSGEQGGASQQLKSLFEGLEEYDNTIEESFTLKPNAKRLILKNKLDSSSKGSLGHNNSLINNSGKENTPISEKDLRARSADSSSNMPKEDKQRGQIILPLSKSNDVDATRRESWLHPNALEKIRQQNQASDSIAENTFSEFVPRKSLEGKDNQNVSAIESLSPHKSGIEVVSRSENEDSANNSFMNESYSEAKVSSSEIVEPHPTGIRLCRVGYYTIPPLDELANYLSEDETTCIVPNFTIGREGYGNVYFNKPIDVYGLNLDEIVHFRHKEVIIYPNDDNKPPVGSGLNREAQITLDQVWPHDKTIHEPIKDTERLNAMDYEGKLRRVCDKHDIRFIEYRPETGSWVFRVKHFSKYGLNDSDEEDNAPTDPKKLKIGPNVKDTKLNAKQTEKKAIQPSADATAKFGDDIQTTLLDDQQLGLQDEIRKSILDSKFKPGVTNPASSTEALARGIGTDSHKLQLMKASFFIDDDSDIRSVTSENLKERESPDQIVPNKYSVKSFSLSSRAQSVSNESIAGVDFEMNGNLMQPLRADKEVEVDIVQQLPTLRITPLIVKPIVAKVKISSVYIPLEKSIGYKLKGKCVSDMALYNCRYFKFNFGPSNNLYALNTLKHVPNADKEDVDMSISIFSSLKTKKSFTVLQQLKVAPCLNYDSFEKTIVNHLQIQLAHSLRVEIDESDCPFIQCEGREDLLVEHLEEARKVESCGDLESYAVSVWSLCNALWGSREELEGQDLNSHFSIMCRKNLLSDWLENTLIEKNILNKEVNKSAYLNHLTELLMCHQVNEACELAFKYDDANLSLLLAQLSGGPTVRQLVQHQLSIWQKVEADKFIQPERLKLFMLVAGVPIISSSHGPLNVLEGIPWLKALALQLWYLCSPTASITDALIAYDNSFNCAEFYALPPTPQHIEKYQVKSNQPIYDLRYHILQLFSKKSHSMESLLNPATHTPDPMDYRLSWLLLQTFESLGYRHCAVFSESQLHVCFANQLENYDLWHWSVFVLLHIKDKNRRELAVQEILYRHVSLSTCNSEQEKFVVNSLGVPQKWIDWAKAVKAGVQRDYHLQAKFLLRAKQWSRAHEIIMQHIAPDAIINDNIGYLKDLLCQFEDQKSKKIIRVQNWANQGQILLDFIEINEKFERLKSLHLSDIETRWENLKCQLADICSRINLLPCPTAKHRLCQSEIAQKLACLLRGVILACQISNPCLLMKIALEKLPLPQEFAQQELRVLLDAFVADRFNFTNEENIAN